MADYDAWLARECDRYWGGDAQVCDSCGGELDGDNDCMECGEHTMSAYECKCEAAEWRAEDRKYEELGL